MSRAGPGIVVSIDTIPMRCDMEMAYPVIPSSFTCVHRHI
jgi:hypothetical protein